MKKGFTLIELLVVIAIIGILAGLIIVNLSSARARGRDAKRKSDLASIRTAIEMYVDVNNELPDASTLSEALKPYLNVLPKDPINQGSRIYRYQNDGTYYELDADLELDTASERDDGGNNPSRYEVGTNLTILNGGPVPTPTST